MERGAAIVKYRDTPNKQTSEHLLLEPGRFHFCGNLGRRSQASRAQYCENLLRGWKPCTITSGRVPCQFAG
jgi:hypothetical protein